MDFQMRGKTALVTGRSAGIGKTTTGRHPKPFTIAVTYANGGEPSLATHFGRSPYAEEHEWRIVPILRGPSATCLSPD